MFQVKQQPYFVPSNKEYRVPGCYENPRAGMAPATLTSLKSNRDRNIINRSNEVSQASYSPKPQQERDQHVQQQLPEESKYRQLPCKTFVSVGTCPYRDRCVYLHDPRLIHRDAKTKTRKKNSDDVILDSFFWPVMPEREVRKKLDSSRQPHVIQNYSVPGAQQWNNECIHDKAIFSMWMHFTEFCAASNTTSSSERNSKTFDPRSMINNYSTRQRLGMFVNLSNGVIPSLDVSSQPPPPAAVTMTSVADKAQVEVAPLTPTRPQRTVNTKVPYNRKTNKNIFIHSDPSHFLLFPPLFLPSFSEGIWRQACSLPWSTVSNYCRWDTRQRTDGAGLQGPRSCVSDNFSFSWCIRISRRGWGVPWHRCFRPYMHSTRRLADWSISRDDKTQGIHHHDWEIAAEQYVRICERPCIR